jgi:predicted GNAT family acetyltransferase
MTQPTITRHATPTGGEYRARLAGHDAIGLLTWHTRPGASPIWVVDHTLVPTAIGGRGIAARLVEALIEDARKDGATIIPACSYVAAAFDRHPEWADLLA